MFRKCSSKVALIFLRWMARFGADLPSASGVLPNQVSPTPRHHSNRTSSKLPTGSGMCGSVVHVSVSVCKRREYDKEEEEKSVARFLGYCSGIRLMLIRGTTKTTDQISLPLDQISRF